MKKINIDKILYIYTNDLMYIGHTYTENILRKALISDTLFGTIKYRLLNSLWNFD